MKHRKFLVRLLVGGGLLAMAGCSMLPESQPDRTRYYVLASTKGAADGGEAPTTTKPVRVIVRLVSLPEFLRNRIMPVRVGSNELRFVDEARWAEPLDAALTRLIGDRLAQSPGLRVYERRGEPHDCEVAVRVTHAEGVLPAGVVRISAHIEIYSTDIDQRLLATDDFTTDVPGWDGHDYGELAKKLSEGVSALGGRIAELLAEKR